MCQSCYREWRHHHDWQRSNGDRFRTPSPDAPACPCCRLPVHLQDVPPDVLLIGLLAAHRVTCPGCEVEMTMDQLSEHRLNCSTQTTFFWG